MICPGCQSENHRVATFCSHCGQKLIVAKEVDYNIPVWNISLFFFSLLIYICIIKFTPLVNNYTSQLTLDIIFNLIVILFFIYHFKTSIRLFRLSKKRVLLIIKIITIAPLLALAVYYVAGFLNKSVFDAQETIYYNQFKNSPSPILFSLLSISMFPAIFEELAFRRMLFDQSLKIMGLKATILLTSILFTILHLSLISALWLFPGALLLGYLRAKQRSIVYGMLAHFLYNSSIMLFQIILT